MEDDIILLCDILNTHSFPLDLLMRFGLDNVLRFSMIYFLVDYCAQKNHVLVNVGPLVYACP